MTKATEIGSVGLFVVMAMACFGLSTGTAMAGAEIGAGKIVSGTVVGTMLVIDPPNTNSLYSTSGPQGPDWPDDADDGFRLLAGGFAPLNVVYGWEPDGSENIGPIPLNGVGSATYTFNLADAGIDLPDGSVINAIYGSWGGRGVSAAAYSYTEGAQSGSTNFTHTVAPANDLVLKWTDSTTIDRQVNFQLLFNGPITVEGGNGFTLAVAKISGNNSHQSDAIVLDVSPPVATPGTLIYGK